MTNNLSITIEVEKAFYLFLHHLSHQKLLACGGGLRVARKERPFIPLKSPACNTQEAANNAEERI